MADCHGGQHYQTGPTAAIGPATRLCLGSVKPACHVRAYTPAVLIVVQVRKPRRVDLPYSR